MRWAAVEDLYDYWNRFPPVHELVAAYLEYKPKEVSVPPSGEVKVGIDFADLQAAIKAGRNRQTMGI